jgi:hypothetical protein
MSNPGQPNNPGRDEQEPGYSNPLHRDKEKNIPVRDNRENQDRNPS